jgi:hypothetical protein
MGKEQCLFYTGPLQFHISVERDTITFEAFENQMKKSIFGVTSLEFNPMKLKSVTAEQFSSFLQTQPHLTELDLNTQQMEGGVFAHSKSLTKKLQENFTAICEALKSSLYVSHLKISVNYIDFFKETLQENVSLTHLTLNAFSMKLDNINTYFEVVNLSSRITHLELFFHQFLTVNHISRLFDLLGKRRQIETLTLKNCNFSEVFFLEKLASCTSLKTLNLEFHNTNFTWNSILSMTNLKSLTLRITNPQQLHLGLDSFFNTSFDSLQHLCLDPIKLHDAVLFLEKMVKDKNQTLQSLELHILPCASADLELFFKVLEYSLMQNLVLTECKIFHPKQASLSKSKKNIAKYMRRNQSLKRASRVWSCVSLRVPLASGTSKTFFENYKRALVYSFHKKQ